MRRRRRLRTRRQRAGSGIAASAPLLGLELHLGDHRPRGPEGLHRGERSGTRGRGRALSSSSGTSASRSARSRRTPSMISSRTDMGSTLRGSWRGSLGFTGALVEGRRIASGTYRAEAHPGPDPREHPMWEARRLRRPTVVTGTPPQPPGATRPLRRRPVVATPCPVLRPSAAPHRRPGCPAPARLPAPCRPIRLLSTASNQKAMWAMTSWDRSIVLGCCCGILGVGAGVPAILTGCGERPGDILPRVGCRAAQAKQRRVSFGITRRRDRYESSGSSVLDRQRQLLLQRRLARQGASQNPNDRFRTTAKAISTATRDPREEVRVHVPRTRISSPLRPQPADPDEDGDRDQRARRAGCSTPPPRSRRWSGR